MNSNEPYILAKLSPADEEHMDEYIAGEIFGQERDVLPYSQTLLDAIKVAQMIMVSIPCGFEMSTHPEALSEAKFSYTGMTIYAQGESLPFAISSAGLYFWRMIKRPWSLR